MSKRKLEDWLDSYIQYNDNSEPPLNYIRWCGISLIAAALQRKVRLDWGTLTFHPNMYIVLVGPSGRARKGTAMSPALKIINKLNIDVAAEATTREALIRRLGDITASVEEVGDLYVASHSSLTVFSPELTCFLGYQNLQLMSDLCDWYDCRDKWTYDTKNMGTDVINGIYVNLLGATTPDLIESSMPLDAIGGGLTSRMIFVFEEKKRQKVPMPFIPPEYKDLFDHLVYDLEQMRMMEGQFKVTKAFTDLWYSWYMEQPETCPFDNQRFYGYWERRATHIMKLGMIMSASAGGNMIIERNHLQRAIDILNEAERKMPQTFGGVGKNPYADIMQRILNTVADRGEIMLSELMIMFHRDISADILDKILTSMRTMRMIKRTESIEGIRISWLRPSDNPMIDDQTEDTNETT